MNKTCYFSLLLTLFLVFSVCASASSLQKPNSVTKKKQFILQPPTYSGKI